MVAYQSPLTYVAFDLYTGNYLGTLPLMGVQFGSQVLGAGTLSGTLNIGSPDIQKLGPLGLTAPARTAICVDYLGALIWGGIVWPRAYKYDNTTRQLQVTATELWSYPAARAQATDYSAPPYSNLTGTSTPMAIWNAASATNTWDPVLISWQVLSDALTKVRYGNILGGMGIAANGYTTTAGYLGSGTNTPTGAYLSVNYPYSSLQTVGTIVNQLASNGLGVGFDYAVDVAYSRGPGSSPVGTVNLSYPQRGRSAAQNGLVIHGGQMLDYELPEDGTQAANTVYEQGASGALVISQNLTPLQAGYPILEAIKSRSNITSANVINVLTAQGVSDLAMYSFAPATPSVTLDLFSSSVTLGQFITGDNARWVIPATDGTAQVFDPRIPNGLDAEYRITAWNAQVADEGQSKLTLTLGTPPVYSAISPPVPS